ncbi:hypothetical protein GW721_11890 [Citrobacter braakii]|nr:hypothetical protein [Citrobacter braakii]
MPRKGTHIIRCTTKRLMKSMGLAGVHRGKNSNYRGHKTGTPQLPFIDFRHNSDSLCWRGKTGLNYNAFRYPEAALYSR